MQIIEFGLNFAKCIASNKILTIKVLYESLVFNFFFAMWHTSNFLVQLVN